MAYQQPIQTLPSLTRATYTALERTTVDVVAIHVANGHGCVVMRVHFDECEPAVCLESRFDHKAKVLEQGNHVVGRRVRGQIANIAGGLPRGGLADHDIVRVRAVRWELVMAERRRGCHAHGLHRLLLSDRGLTLLVSPVAANRSRAEPFSIHRAERLFGVWPIPEGNKAVTTRAASFHVPHDTSFRDSSKGRKSLQQDLVVYFVGQIADKDVEVARRVLLAGSVRLVGPVDSNFLHFPVR